MKFGHVATIGYAINSLQEMDGEKVVKGLNKDQARMVHSINEAFNQHGAQDGSWEDNFKGELGPIQMAWVKDRIEDIFSNQLMPVWAVRWSLELLEM